MKIHKPEINPYLKDNLQQQKSKFKKSYNIMKQNSYIYIMCKHSTQGCNVLDNKKNIYTHKLQITIYNVDST